jgi:Phage tail protein
MITKLQIGSVSFNDNDNFLVSEVSGLEMPSMRVSSFDLAGQHFGVFVSAFYGKRAFSIKGWVRGVDVNDFLTKKDTLLAAINLIDGEEDIFFTLANGKQVKITAIATNVEFRQRSGEINASQFSISFVASFPFLVGQVENSTNLVLGTGGGGKVPSDTMPSGLSMGNSGSVTIINNGNAPYFPMVRFTGPVTNPTIQNLTNGKSIRLNATLLAGEYIDVDFKRKKVTDNYGSNRYSTKSGDWWYLSPGNNALRFSADVYDANSLATVTSRDSYLGI